MNMDSFDDSKDGFPPQAALSTYSNMSYRNDMVKESQMAKDSIYTFSDNCDSDEGELKYKIKNILNSPKQCHPSTDVHGAAVVKEEAAEAIAPEAATGSERLSDDGCETAATKDIAPYKPSEESQSTEKGSSQGEEEEDDATSVVVPVRVKRVPPNGSIPKTGGKPMAYAMEKKKQVRKPKRKALVAMYQSQISDNKIGIKLKLKKSDILPAVPPRAKSRKTVKSNRKRTRKPRTRHSSDSEDSTYTKRPRKERVNNNRVTAATAETAAEPVEQTIWGSTLPENVLYQIFQYAVKQEGCLPTLIRLGKVCSMWHRISLSPSLWYNLDLSTWTKDRTELKLKWLIENRLQSCQEVNLANWKVANIDRILEILVESSPNLVGITLSGWKGFTSDQLMYLVQQFKLLQRIDLSSINVEMNSTKSAVGSTSLCNAIQELSERLTHLNLAHNRLAGIPQIVTALSTYTPNLILLDLSNVNTIAVSHGILHIEKLQQGCQKLKVLRVTNSHITLSVVSLQEQMDSPGFPDLEELSIASLATESRLINDEFLQRILKTSTKLQLLDVRGCARLTHDSLIRLPAWDIKHLFLSGCSVTRDVGSGLELIASKWAHSLTEFDLAWANVEDPLYNAIKAIAEKGAESPLHHLNLCGSSVSLEAVKEILINCPELNSINLSSCRGLPRGVKRLLQGTTEITELRKNLGVTLKVPPPPQPVDP